MRPNKLIMSAFGPYSEKVEVDLDKLGQNGIYLITGDTGAGKTTIFDAIAFALYGEASGENRENSMFRSKYAKPEMPTSVELYFTCKEKKYYIKRNPEYIRPKSRGEGITTEKANVALTLPNGKVITKLKEVNSAVSEIIGIDQNQFKQIAMIAQGDFLKLLLTTTDERKEIFQKLFKTQNYNTLQDRLKSESAALKNKYAEFENNMAQYINEIMCDEDSTDYIELKKAKNGDLPEEETILLIEKLISDDEKTEKNFSEEKKKLQRKLDEITAVIIKAEEIIKSKRESENYESKLQFEYKKQKELEEKLNLSDTRQKENKKSAEKSLRIRSTLPDYDELTVQEKTFNKNKIFIDKHIGLLLKTKENIKIKQDEAAALESELKILAKIGEEKIQLENDIKKYREEKEKLEKIVKNINDSERLCKKYTEAKRYYEIKRSETESLSLKLEHKRRIYREEQAGILADTLEYGMPCPVCGSVTHPQKAKKPPEVPTKEEINALEEILGNAKEEENKAITEAGTLKGSSDEKKENVKKEVRELFGNVSPDNIKDFINLKLSETLTLTDKLSENIKETRIKIERKDQIEKLLPQKKTELKTEEDKLLKIKEEIALKTAENSSAEKRIAEFTAKLDFATKAEAEKEIYAIDEKIRLSELEYNKILDAFTLNKEKIISLQSAKNEIEKRIGSNDIFDPEKERNEKKELEEKMEQLEKKVRLIHTRTDLNKSSLGKIHKKLKEINETKEKLIWMKSLSDTANGNISGREKIMLETYIQMTYFDRIINRANTSFMIMSGGQYELKRRIEAVNNRSQSGLELNVIDHYNGTERSVKTLSGGESFKASLSLALGLADEIQSSAGGIKLDTMFIDEGFGSLDEESLSQAIKVLSSLADGNRLVGIISHVGELKEHIEKQIIVKKEKAGGSNIKIIF